MYSEENKIKVEVLSELSGELFPSKEFLEATGEDGEPGTVFPLSGIELTGYKSEIVQMVRKESNRYFQSKEPGCQKKNALSDIQTSRASVIVESVTVKEIEEVLYGCILLRMKEFPKERELFHLCENISVWYRNEWAKQLEQKKIQTEEGALILHFGAEKGQRFRVCMTRNFQIDSEKIRQKRDAAANRKNYFRNRERGR